MRFSLRDIVTFATVALLAMFIAATLLVVAAGGYSSLSSPRSSSAPHPPAALWSVDTEEKVLAVSTAGDLVFVSTSQSARALNLNTGEEIWRFPRYTGQNIAPLLCGGIVVFPKLDSSLMAFDAQKGYLLWQNTMPHDDTSSRIVSMACGQNILVVVRRFGPVVAYSLATGKEIWRYPLSLRASVDIAIDSSVVYVPAIYQGVFAINIKNGNLIHHFAIRDAYKAKVIDHRVCVAVGQRKNVYVVVLSEAGKVLGEIPLGDETDVDTISIHQHSILFSTGKSVASVSFPQGHTNWIYESIEGRVRHAPQTTDGLVFFRDAYNLYILQESNGMLQEKIPLGNGRWQDFFLLSYPVPVVAKQSRNSCIIVSSQNWVKCYPVFSSAP